MITSKEDLIVMIELVADTSGDHQSSATAMKNKIIHFLNDGANCANSECHYHRSGSSLNCSWTDDVFSCSDYELELQGDI